MRFGFSAVMCLLGVLAVPSPLTAQTLPSARWEICSLDTMKSSRDAAAVPLDEARQQQIRQEIKAIAATHATHIAISTPYDEQFAPLLQFWADQAHAQGLKVWFRGNFSAWEGWFDHKDPITSYQQHLDLTRAFIVNHPRLFVDGDIFDACPEAENSKGIGDPRSNGKREQFLQFMRDSYDVKRAAFAQINKQVICNVYAMNADIARYVLDQRTVDYIGGLVTIDHYVPNVAKMDEYVDAIHRQFNCKVLLGEFGAPLAGMNLKPGDPAWTPAQQADFLSAILTTLQKKPYVCGFNYWVATGDQNELTHILDWDAKLKQYTPRPAAEVLTAVYATQGSNPVNRSERPRP